MGIIGRICALISVGTFFIVGCVRYGVGVGDIIGVFFLLRLASSKQDDYHCPLLPVGYEIDNQTGRNSIFRKPNAYADCCEEQGRFTLHSHISI